MKSLYFKEEHTLFRNSVRQFMEKEVIPYIEIWETERKIHLSGHVQTSLFFKAFGGV